jgi:sulfite exporter TauE/SafE/copper chaperone CopZ
MSKTKTKIISVAGMHCRACELLLESQLKTVPNVVIVKANQRQGKVVLLYRHDLNEGLVKRLIIEAGYQPKTKAVFLPLLSREREVWGGLGLAVLLAAAGYGLYWLAGLNGLSQLMANDYGSLPVVFVVGLTAGISTCMALVGGLVLGVSAKYNQLHPEASAKQKFVPQLFFNAGRLASFMILGGVIGWLGSLVQISFKVQGLLIILVALVMLFLGAQLLGIFPRLTTLSLTLPKGLTRRLGLTKKGTAIYSHRQAVILGALTFFLPCGFTQAMQLYAITSGSAVTGALTLGVFALGTAPGLLGVGGLSSVVKGKGAKLFFQFAGVIVMALAAYNFNQGWNILTTPNLGDVTATNIVSQEVQVLTATFHNKNLVQPQEFRVNVNQPVRLEIAAQTTGRGCTRGVILPSISTQVYNFNEGETVVIEFTPTKKGNIKLMCNMQMITYGVIKVV